jgi:hypothetical protein
MNKIVIKKYAEMIKKVNNELGVEPTLYIGDPSMSQKNGITATSALDEYRRHGIPVMAGKKDVSCRINKMNEYLKYDMWVITQQCPNTIKEFRGYSFKIYTSAKIADRNNKREEPNKKNDHACDSCGYFFGLMPYLTPEIKNLKSGMSQTLTNREDFPWEVDTGFYVQQESSERSFGEV